MLLEKNFKLLGVFESFFDIKEKGELIENLQLFNQVEFQSKYIIRIIKKQKKLKSL